MTQRQSLTALLAQVSVAVAALVAATVLCAMGKLEGEAVVAVISTALALAGTASAATARAAIDGGPKPDFNRLAESSPEASIAMAEAHYPHTQATSSSDTHR